MSALMDAPVTPKGKRGRKPRVSNQVMAPLAAGYLAAKTELPRSEEWAAETVELERKPYVGARVLFIQRGMDGKLMAKPADLVELRPQTPERIAAGGEATWNLNVQNWGSMYRAGDVGYCGREWKDCCWCWPDEIVSWSDAAGPVE